MSELVTPAQQLWFGVEIEVSIGHRYNESRDPELYKCETWTSFASELSERLHIAEIDNTIDGEGGSGADYTKWTITSDGSIGNNVQNRKWGIELISGIGCFNSKEWREHLKIVWKVLETFDIELSERCGTHVHVSVKDCKWTSTQVENLALAVNLFEKATEILVPKDRLSNSYCKSNRHNPRLAMLTMPEVFDAVKKCSEAPRQEHGAADAAPTDGHTNFEALASLVCYCGKAPCGKDIYERSFRWNFTPLAKVDGNGPKNTVEFRLPSGSTFAEHTIAWIEFTGFFVLAAIDSSYNLDGNRIPWLKDLRDFIHAGAKRAGIDDMQFIDFIFDGKIDPEFSGTLRHLTHRRSRSDDSISASTRQSWGDLIIHRRSRSDTPLSAAFENMLKSDYRKQVPERPLVYR